MKAININQKPATKPEALKTVTKLLEGAAPDIAEIERLYLYFMPAAPKTPKNPEQWLAKFVAKKDIREGLNYLYSDGATLWATNGHLMARCPTTRPAGYYCPRTFLPADVEYTYPNAQLLFDSCPAGEPKPLAKGETRTGTRGIKLVVDVYGGTFSNEYINVIESGGNPVVLTASDGESVMRGKTDLGDWLVMPVRK